MSSLDKKLDQLSPQKRALYELMLQEKAAPLAEIPRAVDPAPLSFAQQRLWFLDQLEPGTSVYNLPRVFRLVGPLKPEVLQRSLTAVVAAHEALRTTFDTVDGKPVQVLHSSDALHLEVVDLSDYDASNREAKARRQARQETRRPFDLKRDLPLRVRLLRLNIDEHFLVLTMHHIATDAWSFGLLFQQLGEVYGTLLAGGTAPDLTPPIRYADFAAWQRQRLSGKQLERELSYWCDQLEGSPPLLDLPTDRPRPPVQTFRGARLDVVFNAAVSRRLARVGQDHGATLFMTLLAAFYLLLERYSGQSDLSVGSPIANRNRKEVEGLIGFFVNTLVLRARFKGCGQFSDLLAQVRETTLGAYSHQDMPFEKLVEELSPERHLSHQPLFQVMFQLQTARVGPLELAGLQMQEVKLESPTTTFDLTVSLIDHPEGIRGFFSYNRDLWNEATMQRMADHFANLLAALADDPSRPLREISLLDEAERRQLTGPWAGGESLPEERCVHELVAAQAQRNGDAPALVLEHENISYRQLDRRANQFAHHLLALGVEPEDRVGIALEPSLALLEAVLGTLKAGAAYVPLDVSHPPERLAFLTRDSDLEAVLLTTSQTPLFEGTDLVRVLLDQDREAIARRPDTCPSVQVDPAQTAYLIYTSGSTGRPKAVMVPHRALSRRALGLAQAYGVDEVDRNLQFIPLSFDVAADEIFTVLTQGASLAIAAGTAELSPADLLRRAEAMGATMMHLPVAYWHLLVDHLEAADLPMPEHFRRGMVGGEAISVTKLATWAGRVRHPMRFFNAYGPTEATITSTIHEIESRDSSQIARLARVPIGHPLLETEVYLLSPALDLVPIGVPGELAVGGAGLARGYRGRPGLTAERFVPHPFAAGGERLYLTGDLARHLESGELDFLGRRDHQVKVRGVRIELGEVEAALRRHPELREAVVLARDGASGKRLVAYVVPTTGEPTAAALRRFLTASLPEAMVPAAFVVLPEFPLTATGKLDRAALPEPEVESVEDQPYQAPKTPVEWRLAEIWQEVLSLPRVGREDDFFALGGHSLLAIQLMTRVHKAFAVEVPLRVLFESRTIAGLAVAVRAAESADQGDSTGLPTIVPDAAARHEPFPLTDIQQAYWVGRSGEWEMGNVGSHGYLESEFRQLDLERFENAWRKVIARHDMMRMVVTAEGLQRVLPAVEDYEITVLDLRELSEDAAEEQLEGVRREMSHQVLDPTVWPLFDIRASRLSGGRLRLHFSFDALLGDAWSFRLLTRDLARFYRDPEAPLEPLALSFRDYVLAEVELKKSAVFQKSLAYWRERLPALPPAPELPLVTDPGALVEPRFVRRSRRLEAAAWERLKGRFQQAGLTPSGALLTAFADVLAIWSRRSRFTLNLTLFNRPPLHPEIRQIVGDFTSLTLLEVDASASGSFAERVRRIEGRLWEDLDHRYVSGVEVLRELSRAASGAVSMPVVFTSALNLRDRDEQPIAEDRSLAGERIYSITQTPQVWLDHQVSEHEGGLAFNWDAVEELFPDGLLDAMFGAYCTHLKGLAEDDAAWQREGRQHLLPAATAELAAAANRTAAPVPGGLLHSRFFERAAQAGERTAIIDSHREMSYGELARIAGGIGLALRQRGVERGELVAVVLEKGWEQVAAVLGVLASGAAYLPIDPSLPTERLAYLLKYGRVRLVLTQAGLRERLPAAEIEVLLVCVEMATEEAVGLPAHQRPEDLAYVIFTSGSTGLPKGVMIDHRGAINTIVDVNQRFQIGAEDRVLALSSLAFDLSVWDIFGVLAVGGAVVLPEEESRRDPARWAELVARFGVTVWNTVPALMEMLVEYVEGQQQGIADGLRLVMMSGDWIPVSLPARIRSLWREVEIISLGGATEASIWSILYPIGEVDSAWSSIPYGRAMVNQTFHVFDEALAERPCWVPGELYIGGVGVALGYWRDEEKTSGSFLTHPQTGERLYRTGDLGRWRDDGNIEFLGREDSQVKVQGHRIELGEIETALLAHAGVQTAAVTAPEETRGKRRLVGYAVALPGGSLEVEELRAFLAGKLPSYMVPRTIVILESLPLTANGKVDRRALPTPEAAESAAGGAGRPHSPVVSEIARWVADELGVAEVDTAMPLVELGVSSVHMVRIANRLEERFGFRPKMDLLFRSSVSGELARFYEERLTDGELEFDHEATASAEASAAAAGAGDGLPAFTPIRDPAERERFKSERRGVRGDLREAPGVDLGGPEVDEALRATYARRRSHRTFAQRTTTTSQLRELLACVRPLVLDGEAKYLYGSAGGLYPVQIYLYVQPERVEGVAGGLYYHHPLEHRLVELAAGLVLDAEVHAWVNRSAFESSAFSIFLIADLDAIGPMYGKKSRDFCLLEAGLLSQLLEMEAARCGLGLCQMGSVDLQAVRDQLQLGDHHVLLHNLVGGPVDETEPGAARPPTDSRAAVSLPRVVPAPQDAHQPFPLTDIQQAYWIGRDQAFDLGDVSAHLYIESELPTLDVERLEQAWARLIKRHDMLRAAVLPDGTQQVLTEVPEVRIKVCDLASLEPEELTQRLNEIRQLHTSQGPSPDSWPLFDLKATHLGNGRHRLHFSLSLLICDAMTFNILSAELAQLYRDPEKALPPLELRYRDVVLALRRLEKEDVYQRSLSYWRDRVKTLPPAPELPLAKNPATMRGARFVRRRGGLPQAAWQEMKGRAARTGVTPTVVLTAAYAEVLATWSKSPRFSINVLFFNRLAIHPQVHQVVGNFSSTILLEVEVQPGESFARRAQRIQGQLLRDMEHSHVTGIEVMRELNRRQGGTARAAMPVVLASTLNLGSSQGDDPPPETAQDPASGQGKVVYGALQTPQVWLDHQAAEQDGALLFNWDAVEDLFPAGMLDAMFAAYRDLLTRLSAGETAWEETQRQLLPAAQLEVMTASNQTAAVLPTGLLHGPFYKQAARQPERLAVIDPRRRLSYGELARLAARGGRALRQRGARPNELVAVVMEKGWEQVAAVLAVLASGAAYLPIDPALPAERIHYLLEHGQVTLALTQPAWCDGLEWPAGVEVLTVDAEVFADVDATPLAAVQSAEDLAYVIFTSGSTGLPKGVMIDHRGALNTIVDINQRFAIGGQDRVLALSSLSFDLSVWDVFGILAAGGAIVLPEPAARREPKRWVELMDAFEVTVWNTVPALMEMLVEHGENQPQEQPTALRQVMMSGDWIPVSLPARIRGLFPQAEVTSLGGATEASIWSILYPIGEVPGDCTSIPYGHAMVNQTFHVFDEALAERPFWVPGELYIGGSGVARGYWRDEEKTRASFFDHPQTGERLYRTGDLGRWLPDGEIEFLGREDFQVKVQGHRIELGEIEAALVLHPMVQSAAVAAVGEARGNKRLVGYTVPLAAAAAPDFDELRDFLARKLPEYMIPRTFVVCASLPLTSNGKVDRNALAELGSGVLEEKGFVAPRNALEQQLAALWRELLDSEEVGVTDNFFELGGHSLLAVRLMTRIEKQFGRALPLATLFAEATVASLATALDRSQSTEAEDDEGPLVKIRDTGSQPPLFVVHPVGGNVLCYRELAGLLEAEIPFYGLRSPAVGWPDPDTSIPAMAAHYIAALRRVAPEGPYHLAGWSMGGVVVFEMAQQLLAAGKEVSFLGLIDTWGLTPEYHPGPVEDATLVFWFARDLGGLLGHDLALDVAELRPLERVDQLGRILERGQQVGALPPELGEDELARQLTLFITNFRAMLAYRPTSYAGRLDFFLAREEEGKSGDPSRGWNGLAHGGKVHHVDGDHYTMVRSPAVQSLAKRLTEALDEVHST